MHGGACGGNYLFRFSSCLVQMSLMESGQKASFSVGLGWDCCGET